MKALTFQGIEKVSYESVDDPEIFYQTDVIVRPTLTAICGSDLHVYHGRETGLDQGTVLGHEMVGEVVEVGRDVERFAVGDRVLAPFTTNCGVCFYCQHDLTSRCDKGQLLGWVHYGRGLQGAQAELVKIALADTTLLRTPEGANDEEVLLAGDVLSTGYFCAENGGVGPGSVVAILGCGPVGLMAVIGARELGAERILAIDRVPERLALAKAYGATPVDMSAVNPLVAVHEVTEGRGADVVLEAVGSPLATRLGVDLLRPGGTLSSVGVHTESSFPFTPVEAYDKNLTFKSGRCPARFYMEKLTPLVVSRRYDLAKLFSHRLPLADGVRGYEIFANRTDGCTKVVLTP